MVGCVLEDGPSPLKNGVSLVSANLLKIGGRFDFQQNKVVLGRDLNPIFEIDIPGSPKTITRIGLH